MPSVVTIPSRSENRCEPCEFHKRVAAFYGRNHSWQDYDCTHPDAHASLDKDLTPEQKQWWDERCKAIGDALGRGRHIGKTELQPEWCPLLTREAVDT